MGLIASSKAKGVLLQKLSLKYMREHQVKSQVCAVWYFVTCGFFSYPEKYSPFIDALKSGS